MGQQTVSSSEAEGPSDGAVDQMIADVGDALDRLDCDEADELSPSAAEAVLALLGCYSDLRPGPWRALASRLRSAMLLEAGLAGGTC